MNIEIINTLYATRANASPQTGLIQANIIAFLVTNPKDKNNKIYAITENELFDHIVIKTDPRHDRAEGVNFFATARETKDGLKPQLRNILGTTPLRHPDLAIQNGFDYIKENNIKMSPKVKEAYDKFFTKKEVKPQTTIEDYRRVLEAIKRQEGC